MSDRLGLRQGVCGHSNTGLLLLLGLQLSEESVGDGVDGEGSGVQRDAVVDSSQLRQLQVEPHHIRGLREVSGDDE